MSQTAARLPDFKAIKERVSIEDVVDHYALNLGREGESLVGICPLCGGSARTRKFRVTPAKNAWKCFGCDKGGNQLDLVAAIEEVSLREAGEKLIELFGLDDCRMADKRSRNRDSERSRRSRARPSAGSSTREAASAADYGDEEASEPPTGELRHNPPLSWPGLKNLETEHDAIVAVGLMPDTVAHFKSGICGAGMMKGRLAVSLHNGAGDLIGYCGVALDGKGERLKWPPSDKFEQGLELYNMHRALASKAYETDGLIVVEDFLDLFRCFEAGYENVVALMGTELTEQQLLKLRAIDNPSRKFTIFASPDNPASTLTVCGLARFAWVRLVTPKEKKHPRELPPSKIGELLA